MKCRRTYADDRKFREYRDNYKNQYNRKRNYGDGSKRPWTEEETRIVMEHRITDTEIAKLLRRSLSAVQCRRHKVLYSGAEEKA